MSAQDESVFPGKNLPGPLAIADMPPWHFWTTGHRIGLSPDEIEAMNESRPIALVRLLEIQEKVKHDYQYLRETCPPGVQHWMPYRRAMN